MIRILKSTIKQPRLYITHDEEHPMYIVLVDCGRWYEVDYTGTYEQCLDYVRGAVK